MWLLKAGGRIGRPGVVEFILFFPVARGTKGGGILPCSKMCAGAVVVANVLAKAVFVVACCCCCCW